MTDEEVDHFLQGRRTMSLATIGGDDEIHLVALWYGFVGGLIAVETKSKSKKVVNLRKDPRVSLMVEGGESYDQLQGVQIVGRAEVRDDDASMFELGVSIFTRYQGPYSPDLTPLVEQLIHNRVAVVVHPRRVVSWDHTKLSLPHMSPQA
jgi:PPOX class probable F420-dependent enzyme